MSNDRGGTYPVGAHVTLEGLASDPHPLIADLIVHEPVSWLPAIGGWLVTSRELAIAVLRDDDTYTVDDPRFSTAQVIGPSMLSLDGSAHRRHRDPFADPFRAADVRRRLEEWTSRRARQLIDGFAGDGRAELKSALAAPLAVEVMTEALGLVGLETLDLLSIYDAIVAAVDEVTAGNELPQSGLDAFQRLEGAVVATIDSGPNSLPAVVRTGGDLDDDEIASNIAVLLFGGIVTSEGTAGTLFYRLLGDEQQLAAVLADRSLVPGAVEEALRIEPAASVVDRYATRDAVLGDARIHEGDLVRVSLAGASRDPSVFDDPDRFDVRRPNANQHLAFARGPHACLGIHLARLEARAALNALLDALPSIRLDHAASRPPHGLVFRGPDAVVATWDST